MKVKILIVPLLIILIIVGMIWFVYPSYTDSVAGGMVEKKLALKTQEAKSATLTVQIDNIKKLGDDIAKNSDKKDVLFQFLPEKANEERIISDLNFLVSQNKVNLGFISVNKITPAENNTASVAAALPQAVASPNIAPNPTADTSSAAMATPQPKPVAGTVSMNVSATGKYSDLKSFLSQIYSLKRFNRVKSVNFTHTVSADGKVSPDLNLVLVLEFNYYQKGNVLVGYENINFPLGKFDMKIVDDLVKSRNTDGVGIDLGNTGKSDPFNP